MRISFFVPGIPVSQGSKTPYGTESNKAKLDPWRGLVSLAAKEAMKGSDPHDGLVALDLQFRFPRPKAHRKADGNLRAGVPYFKSSKPDIDKLVRAVCDSMTGIVFTDDALVADLSAAKVYAIQPGALVKVYDDKEWS